MDAAVLDVSSFATRHPGGARLIINALGTDVTSEMLGKDASIGNFNMAFTPHAHTEVSMVRIVKANAVRSWCINSSLLE